MRYRVRTFFYTHFVCSLQQVAGTKGVKGNTMGAITQFEAHVVLEKLTQINVVTQSFRAQLFLELCVRGGANDSELVANASEWFVARFEFLNKLTLYKQEDFKRNDGENLLLTQRIDAEFSAEFLLHEFPSDMQKCEVVFTINCSHLAQHPAEIELSETHPSKVKAKFGPGNQWLLSPKLSIKGSRSDPEDSVKKKTYPTLRIIALVKRRPWYYVTNVFLPMSAFVVMAFTSFMVDRSKNASRMGISLTLVLTTASFKHFLTNILPAISYLTLLDQYIHICQLFLFLIVLENGFVGPLHLAAGNAVDVGCACALGATFVLVGTVYFARIVRLAVRPF